MNFLEGWYNACKQEHLHSITLHTFFFFLSNLENVLQNHVLAGGEDETGWKMHHQL